MKKQHSYALVTIIMIVTLLAQSWGPLLRGVVGSAVGARPVSAEMKPAAALADCFSVFLPAVISGLPAAAADQPKTTMTTGALGGPDFEIISPANGGTIAGMGYFAVQPVDPVSSVSFKAGSTDLGSDNTPADGFKVFLDAGDFPSGTLSLSATARNLCGSTTKSVDVTVENEPSSADTIGPRGAVLATEIGSLITFPPGALPAGTTVSVTEKTQEQVTAENGFDWDAMGVTFLGAQQITASVPISLPLGVASAGFGNRVQPGQAVVNYRIAPDADGDGVDELIVVNTATVAPNDDVISDPIPKALLNSAQTQASSGAISPSAPDQAIVGPPGTVIQLDVSGFNPFSAFGNIATFRSSVDGAVVELPGIVLPDHKIPSATGDQLFVAVVPPMTPGPATLTLRNQTTGYTTQAVDVTVEEPAALQAAARDTIDTYLAELPQVVDGLDTSSLPPRGQAMFSKWQETLDQEILDYIGTLDQLNESDQEVQAFLNAFAAMIETATLLADPQSLDRTGSTAIMAAGADVVAATFGAIASGAGVAATDSAIAGLSTAHTRLTDAAVTPVIGWSSLRLVAAGVGFLTGMALPGLINPVTGMGAATPSGGSVGGYVSSGNNLLAPGEEPRSFIIQLYSGGSRLPFSGMTDLAGYFTIPIIPEGEPYTALAIDTGSGDTRTINGIGPAIGDSDFLYFDFLRALESFGTAIEIGQVVTGVISTTAQVDVYSFEAAPGQTVFFDEQGASGNLRWQVVDGLGNMIVNEQLSTADPGLKVLEQGGVYIVTVSSNGGTGSYQFQIWNVPPPDVFAISIGDVVSPGVPGPGAGTIESPGVRDIYNFTAVAGQTVFFDVQGQTGVNTIDWQVVDEDGTIIFDTCLGCSDPGVKSLIHGGTYTLTVGEDRDDKTGTYQFQLWNVPPPDVFAISIGDVVSPGVPGPGAGTIETPGVRDIYNFTAVAGQTVFFDVQGQTGVNTIDWQVVDENGTVIFDTCLGCSDPGVKSLIHGGTYTLTVGEERDDKTGTYEFQMWNVPPPDVFAISIGDVVSPGVPGPGAGTIETPGVRDIYNFTAVSGQSIYFDNQGQSGVGTIDWQLVDEEGTILFDTCLGCSDPGVKSLVHGGTYTLTVGEERDEKTGTYQFQLWNVPPPDVFAISIGDVVSPGVPGPGAGTIESPGVQDIYNFTAVAGQTVFFDVQGQTGVNTIDWQVVDEEGTIIFDTCLGCSDPGVKSLVHGGTYTLTVGEERDEKTGTYQFQIWNVPPPDVFAISVGDVVSPGVPGPGAGTIETPGVRDIYNFTAVAGQIVFFDVQGQTGVNTIDWQLVDEEGTIIFDTCLGCSDPGEKTLVHGGTYTLTVGEDGDEKTGTYRFQLNDSLVLTPPEMLTNDLAIESLLPLGATIFGYQQISYRFNAGGNAPASLKTLDITRTAVMWGNGVGFG